MALRLFFQHCLSAPSKILSAQLPYSAVLLQGITSTRHPSSVPSHTAYTALHPRTCARIFSTTPVCRVTFNVQDEEDFEERVIKSPTPVIVDFHAQWCGPCKILAPRLERLVAHQNGKVVMAKVDIDDHTDLALAYEVSAVPTVVAVKCGKVVDKFVGLMDEKQLEVFVKKLVG